MREEAADAAARVSARFGDRVRVTYLDTCEPAIEDHPYARPFTLLGPAALPIVFIDEEPAVFRSADPGEIIAILEG
ncbi:MAG: hypothetical protein WC971_03850 [Coriobacteriia bacterium]